MILKEHIGFQILKNEKVIPQFNSKLNSHFVVLKT